MRTEQYYPRESQFAARLAAMGGTVPRRAMVGVILMISLAAFEMFNFDTTQYALGDLLGNVEFLGLRWASILAIAFCSIDFAGLIRLFTPEKGADEPKEVWYLMGAWLLGATMNAIMTWWAVSLTLLNHEFGNEVLSRQQLLSTVPIFVAVLVWLTRILFIGAFTVAGEHIFDFSNVGAQRSQQAAAAPAARKVQPQRAQPASQIINRQRQSTPPPPEPDEQPAPQKRTPAMPRRQNSRVRQRPPRPNGTIRRVPAGVHASPRR